VRGKNSCWKTWVTKGFAIESKISSKMHTIRVPIRQTKKGDNKHVKSKYGFILRTTISWKIVQDAPVFYF
jgi:hypothetical protein